MDECGERFQELLLRTSRLEEENVRLRAALAPFALVEECGIGKIVDSSDDEHNEQCHECRNILAARKALGGQNSA